MRSRTGPAGCVVFDLDDTIYLERDYVRSGFDAVGEWVRDRVGVPDFAERAWQAFESGVRGTIFDRVLAECGVAPDAEVVLVLVDVYRNHEPAIQVLPDARAALDALSGQVPLGAVTDGPIRSQLAKARALGVDEWSQVTVLTEQLGPGYGKPHPRAFQEIERSIGHDGPSCVYVADNPAKDFAAPRALGWRTVRVRRAQSLHVGADSGPDVDFEVADLGGLDRRLSLQR